MNDDETPTPRETPAAMRAIGSLEEMRALIHGMTDSQLTEWLCSIALLEAAGEDGYSPLTVSEVELHALEKARGLIR